MLLKSSPVPRMGFAAVAMKNLFTPKTPKIEPPKPARMPTAMDPEVEAASRRTRERALNRKGRLSTILTDQTSNVVGSSGQKLGA